MKHSSVAKVLFLQQDVKERIKNIVEEIKNKIKNIEEIKNKIKNIEEILLPKLIVVTSGKVLNALCEKKQSS